MNISRISAIFVLLLCVAYTGCGQNSSSTENASDYNTENSFIDVQSYGAIGDGITDDTAAIQNAINSERNVYLPSTSAYYKITSPLTLSSNSSLTGDGIRSQIRQVTSNANVINGIGVNDILIAGLDIYGPGDAFADATGNGIYLAGSSRVHIEGNKFENIGNTGIHLKDTTYSQIIENEMVSFIHYRQDSADIALKYSSSYNIVRGNKCTSGTGVGILVQAIALGDTANNNIVENNLVTAHDRYGIILYARNGATAADVIGNKVIGNTVKNISDVTGTYFGAGIYAQGVRQTIIANNHVENTNNGTTVELLAPGGIGVTGSSDVIVTGNTVKNAKWYGITVRDPFGIGGHYTVSDNTVSGSGKSGIYSILAKKVKINGNTVSGGNSHGICLYSTSGSSDAQILGNTLISNAQTGINSIGYNHTSIKDNIARYNGIHGIAIQSSTEVEIEGNHVYGNGVRGIDINTGNSFVIVKGNIAEFNNYGIVRNPESNPVTFIDNISSGNATFNWLNVPI